MELGKKVQFDEKWIWTLLEINSSYVDKYPSITCTCNCTLYTYIYFNVLWKIRDAKLLLIYDFVSVSLCCCVRDRLLLFCMRQFVMLPPTMRQMWTWNYVNIAYLKCSTTIHMLWILELSSITKDKYISYWRVLIFCLHTDSNAGAGYMSRALEMYVQTSAFYI